MEEQCVFCEIINRDRPASIIFENDFLISFLDRYPLNRGHLLVVPKEHYQYLTDMENNDVARLFEIVNMLSKHVWKTVAADGLNISQSNGLAASQDIFHVHIHIIPRFINDTDNDSWPTRKNITEEELDNLASLIKSSLN
tara:strand:- start:3947 stop:4366 length:420 start_codon:yes stop_codon:yes gene_type:complete